LKDVRLLLAARSEDKLKEVTLLCNQLGSIANYVKCDVSVESECKYHLSSMSRNLIERCIQIYSRIDLLILNAGVNAHTFFEDMKDLDVFKRIMDTNFYGYVYCTRYHHRLNQICASLLAKEFRADLGDFVHLW
jgi:NAD(P)-dependent dehydrogenase (short-subunit alcohol dehydrogenase family)